MGDLRANFRQYDRAESVVFRKTTEEFGGLSNMAAGFPVTVNGIDIRTVEALYQACRFPHRPELQRLIIDQRSPMTAKMVGKPYRDDSRPDWNKARVAIMRWCLRVKLALNWRAFSELLLETGDRPIVEDSRRDDFWGAKRVDSQTLEGMNVLGRLLMELREEIRQRPRAELLTVAPPDLAGFLLDGRSVDVVQGGIGSASPDDEKVAPLAQQPSLFDEASATPPEPASTIEKLRPYSAYQDSGEPWLGEVPAHWDVRRLGQIGALFKGGGGSKEDEVDEGVPCIRYGQLYTSYNHFIERPRSFVSPDRARAYTPIRYGDVLFAGSGETIDDIGKSAVNLLDGDVRCGGDIIVFRPGVEFVPRFMGYVADCRPSAAQKATMGRGFTVVHIYASDLKRLAIPLPPLEEQAAIVRFLDHADRRIRRYIRAKQRLIALLEEQMQAIVQRAVTRGLDPDVRLKPSGVEWLGDIPEHWEVFQLRRLVQPGRRITYGIVQPGEPAPDGRYMVRGQDYSRGWADAGTLFRVSEDVEAPYRRSRLRAGDLVMTIVGAGVGNVALVPGWLEGANITQTTARIGVDPQVAVPEFVAASLSGSVGRSNVGVYVKGAAQPGLNLEHVRIFPIPLPPLDEQREIIDRLRPALVRLEDARQRAHGTVRALREYRTLLVTQAVTGQIDVRQAVAALAEDRDARREYGADELDERPLVEEGAIE